MHFPRLWTKKHPSLYWKKSWKTWTPGQSEDASQNDINFWCRGPLELKCLHNGVIEEVFQHWITASAASILPISPIVVISSTLPNDWHLWIYLYSSLSLSSAHFTALLRSHVTTSHIPFHLFYFWCVAHLLQPLSLTNNKKIPNFIHFICYEPIKWIKNGTS